MRDKTTGCRNKSYTIVAATLLLLLTGFSHPAWPADAVYRLTLPATSASDTLDTLAEKTGHALFYPSSEISSINTNPLDGSYTLPEALEALLKGTPLNAVVTQKGVIVVSVTPNANNQSSNGEKNMNARKGLFAAIAGFLFGAGGVHDGVAQEDGEKNTRQSSYILEEIVVTAQKREQNLQDIPVAISALTTEDIQKQGIENFEDFARQLPGVNLVQPRKNRAQFVIRGITTGQAGSRSQDEVATYINDISVTSTYFAFVLPDLRLFDVERVEVLRGPQGTFFGSGSLGGAVRVTTNKPDATDFDTAIALDTGHTQGGGIRQRYSGMVNVPLVDDTLAIRAVGYYRDEEGFIDNIGTGKENANSTLDKGGRIAVQWAPTDRLTTSLTVLAQDSTPEDGGQIDPSLGHYKRNTVSPNKVISELRIYNATIDYDLGFATLTSSTTVSKSLGNLFDGLNLITDLVANLGQDSEFTAEEIRLVSQTDGPYEWVIGGYYFDQEADQWEFWQIKDPTAFSQQFNVTGIPENARIVDVSSALEAREKALFGELSYRLNEEFTLTGGLRYSKSNMRFVNLNGIVRFGGLITAALGGGGDINDVPPTIFNRDVKADSSVLTGKASISYQPSENQTYYLLASRGYRVGQANTVSGPDPIDPVNGLNIPAQFEPDSLWNYELGAKTTWLDGRLLANVALFYIPWDNIQVAGQRQTDFATFTGNAGKAVSKGIELETLFWPIQSLQLGLNVTLQDAKITSISARDSAVTGVLDGDKLPNSPDFQIAGFAEYTRQLRNGWAVFARLDAQYIDSTINGFSNRAGAPGVTLPGLQKTDAYENVNASIGFDGDNWGLAFYVENLTDNDDFIYIDPAALTASNSSVLRPRTLGIRLDYRY